MKILIAGASGFVGRALVPALRDAGHAVQRLVRGSPRSDDEREWHPSRHELALESVEGVDAAINLAGENIAAGRWSAARRERIMRSRVDTTDTLVKTMAAASRRPRLLINASAVGIYGDRGGEILTERSAAGHGFLPDVCQRWEESAAGAARCGARVVCLRFGIVLGRDGGALGKMLPLFRAGLGGRLGDGLQWMPWVHLDDVIGVIGKSLADERYVGAFNVVAPELATNAEFTRALAQTLQRPAILAVPRFALRLLFGQMADDALLASTRVIPARLTELGYAFRRPSLAGALRASVEGP